MNSCFPVAKLGSLCSKIGSGATPRGGSKVYLESGKFALIRSQNVRNDRFDVNGLVFIEEKNAKQLANVEVESADVLLNITGDSVARCCQVDSSILPARVNQHVAIIRPIWTKLDSQFLRYFLVSPEMQEHMLAWASSGATRNALTKGMIEGFDVPLPSLDEQNAIAHILGTLDKKIEVNRKVSATLEAMAQALFKSWFVDFDPVIDNALAEGNQIPEEFEVRAAARESLGDARKPLPEHLRQRFPSAFTYDEELGWIPEGWKKGSISDLAELNPSAWSRKNAPASLRYVDLASVKSGRIYEVTNYAYADAPSRARRILEVGDTIIGTVRPGNRSFALIQEDGLTGSTGFAVLRPKNSRDLEFIYICLTRNKVIEHFAHLADGGAYPAINASVVADLAIILPPAALLKAYHDLTQHWLRSIGARETENRDLAKTRDTLLPKLLTGEIRLPLEAMELEVAV